MAHYHARPRYLLRITPQDAARLVDDGNNDVDPRMERLVITAEPFDDHHLGLLNDADTFGQDHDHEDGENNEHYRACCKSVHNVLKRFGLWSVMVCLWSFRLS